MLKNGQKTPHKAILVKLHKVTFLLDRITDSTLQKGMGLSFSHFLILMALGRRTLSQRDIAEFHGITEAAVSRQIELLRKKGFLDRQTDATNRRKHVIVLTRRGELQLAKALTLLQKKFDTVMNVWSKREQEQLIDLLHRLLVRICDGDFTAGLPSLTHVPLKHPTK